MYKIFWDPKEATPRRSQKSTLKGNIWGTFITWLQEAEDQYCVEPESFVCVFLCFDMEHINYKDNYEGDWKQKSPRNQLFNTFPILFQGTHSLRTFYLPISWPSPYSQLSYYGLTTYFWQSILLYYLIQILEGRILDTSGFGF